MRKSAKVEVRCTPAEKEAWQRLADVTLSEWIRELANAKVAALEKESHSASDTTGVAVPPSDRARPRVTPSRAPIERRPFRPDFK